MNDLQDVVASLRTQLAAVEAEAAAIRQTIEVLERRSGRGVLVAPDHGSAPRRRGKTNSVTAMTIDVMRGERARDWTIYEVYDALVARGYVSGRSKDPVNGVRTAMARLADRGELVRKDSGVYRLNESSGRGAYGSAPQTPGSASYPSEPQVFETEPGTLGEGPDTLSGRS